MHRRPPTHPTALLLAASLLLAAAGCDLGTDPDEVDVEVVADEAVHPGTPGGAIGTLARTQDEAEAVWDVVGLMGEAPSLDGRALAVAAIPEAADCPWQLAHATVDERVVELELELPDRDCGSAWSPRTFAVLTPGLPDHAELWVTARGRTEPLAPFDPAAVRAYADARELVAEAVEDRGGCLDAYAYAMMRGGGTLVEVRWPDAAGRAVEHGRFEDRVELPDDDVTVRMRLGSALHLEPCTDVDTPEPLHHSEWEATAGSVGIAVSPDPDAAPEAPHATAEVRLRDVVFEHPSEDDRWRLDELDLVDVEVGWFPG